MKILISSGATREPIDEVRFITNFSSGNTGSFLADYLTEQGHKVTFLAGEGSARPRTVKTVVPFSSFGDLDRKFRDELSKAAFDGVIHLAAVSDYSVETVESGGRVYRPEQLRKLDSGDDLVLKLKRNFKIVSRLKDYATAGRPVVIAFKLTDSTSYKEQISAITKLSFDPGVDFVVHNDFNDIKAEKPNRYRVFRKDQVVHESLDRQSLAVELELLIRSQS